MNTLAKEWFGGVIVSLVGLAAHGQSGSDAKDWAVADVKADVPQADPSRQQKRLKTLTEYQADGLILRLEAGRKLVAGPKFDPKGLTSMSAVLIAHGYHFRQPDLKERRAKLYPGEVIRVVDRAGSPVGEYDGDNWTAAKK